MPVMQQIKVIGLNMSVPKVVRSLTGITYTYFAAWSDQKGRYGEPIGNHVIGVTHENTFVISRKHEWKISRKTKNIVSWSTVDNCTIVKSRTALAKISGKDHGFATHQSG